MPNNYNDIKTCYVCLEEGKNKNINNCFLCKTCNAFICKECLKKGYNYKSFERCGICKREPIERIDLYFTHKLNLFHILSILIKLINLMLLCFSMDSFSLNRKDIIINYFVNVFIHQLISFFKYS